MKTLNYVKPICEVVELEREGYILCASGTGPGIEGSKPGSGWDDLFPQQSAPMQSAEFIDGGATKNNPTY